MPRSPGTPRCTNGVATNGMPARRAADAPAKTVDSMEIFAAWTRSKSDAWLLTQRCSAGAQGAKCRRAEGAASRPGSDGGGSLPPSRAAGRDSPATKRDNGAPGSAERGTPLRIFFGWRIYAAGVRIPEIFQIPGVGRSDRHGVARRRESLGEFADVVLRASLVWRIALDDMEQDGGVLDPRYGVPVGRAGGTALEPDGATVGAIDGHRPDTQLLLDRGDLAPRA